MESCLQKISYLKTAPLAWIIPLRNDLSWSQSSALKELFGLAPVVWTPRKARECARSG
jgi:hypothetical protein